MNKRLDQHSAKQAATRVRKYWLSIVCPILILGLIVLFSEFNRELFKLQSEPFTIFVLSMIGIMQTLIFVPLCLKMHVFPMFKNRFQNEDDQLAYRSYICMSLLRIILLCATVIMNFISYFLYENQSNGICILITAIALIFCWTSENKVKDEMQRRCEGENQADGFDDDKR